MAPVMAALGAVGGFLASNIGTISTIASVAGAGLNAAGTIYGAEQQAQYAKDQAKSMKAKGDQEVAIAQRKAMESRRQKGLALGRARVVAAASGGGTGDTVTDIMTGIEQRGEYNALTDMYNGRVIQSDLYREADAVKQAGKDGRTAGYIGAASGLLSAGGTIYSDYANRKAAKKLYDYQMGN